MRTTTQARKPRARTRVTTVLGVLMAVTVGSATACGENRIVVPSDLVEVFLSPALITVQQGATQQFIASGVLMDGDTVSLPTVVPTGSVVWESSNGSVASVNGNGLATALAGGTTTISASAQGLSAEATMNVQATQTNVELVEVHVTPGTDTIQVGRSLQYIARGVDTSGDTINNPSVQWSSSNQSVATINSSGVVSALSTGTTTITADDQQGHTDTGFLEVVAATATQVAPELPRAFLNTSMPSVTGSTITVAAGGNLQAALDAAQPGDELVLAAGAVYTGNFILRNKGGAEFIIIRSDTSLPPEGTRMTPGAAGNLATIQSPNNQPALRTEKGASFYRIVGVAFTVATGQNESFSIVELDGYQTSLGPDIPSDIVLDRIYCYAHANLDVRRCVVINATRSAVIDSYITEIHSNTGDAQAILGYNAPGPIKIVNNFLESTGENVMFGGADPRSFDLTSSDVELRGNHFYKPPAWFNNNLQWSVKNLLELKSVHRILIEGNVFENNWADSQTGWAIIMKSEDNSGVCGHCQTRDVTFRYNHIDNVTGGINIAAKGGPNPMPTRDVLIHNNLITRIGLSSDWGSSGNRRGFQILGGMTNVEISHNTMIMNSADATMGFMDGSPPVDNFIFRGNIIGDGQYGWLGTGTGTGVPTLDRYANPWAWDGNVQVGSNQNQYPQGNFFPGSFTAVGFANFAGGDYSLSPSSPYRGVVGANGDDPGADIATLNAMLANVR